MKKIDILFECISNLNKSDLERNIHFSLGIVFANQCPADRPKYTEKGISRQFNREISFSHQTAFNMGVKSLWHFRIYWKKLLSFFPVS